MNKTLFIALGIFFTIAASVTGLVIIPNWQYQELAPVKTRDGRQYPNPHYGAAALGRKVYIDQGCIYCHSQQVRAKGYGGDIRRGWGLRRSVARDYLYDFPHQLGTIRTGPDLSNIGVRQPSSNWHYLHLFNPQITSNGSVMPQYKYFFKTLPPTADPPPDAVKLPPAFATPTEGYIVPLERGRNLVAYLRSMDRNFDLPEAKQ